MEKTQEEKIRGAAKEIVIHIDKTLSQFLRSIGRPSAPTDPKLLEAGTEINAEIISRHLRDELRLTL